ncbi:MAG: CotH kinase family protein [Balneolales bacterium]
MLYHHKFPCSLLITIPLFLLVFCGRSDSVTDKLTINELLASNSTINADEDGDYMDWIELHNTGTEAIDLYGYGLSDDNDEPFKWVFPDTVLPSGKFLLVWASNKNRTRPGAPLHTSFAVSAAGEEVILTSPDGKRIDEVPLTNIQADYSFGRTPGNRNSWIFFENPTPGEPNIRPGFREQLEPVVFSHDAGFYSTPFELALSHPDPEATIYYTMDGSEPTNRSRLYINPIPVYNRTQEPNKLSVIPTNTFTSGDRTWIAPQQPGTKGTTIRVRAEKPGELHTSDTRSFFILPEGSATYDLPVISIVTDSAHLFSDATGIYVHGRTMNGDYKDTPNYDQRGSEWEREASFEFFEADGTHSFTQNVGLRIHGGWSRGLPQKSFRIYARNQYGKNSIDYPLFPDEPYSSYRRILLRNSGQDWGYSMFRDAAAHVLIRHLNVDTQAYRPVIVFVNGEYWGIHNMRERYDNDYLERVYGVDPENIDLLTGRHTADNGDNEHYRAMIAYMEDHDLSDPLHFQMVETMMDVDHYLDYVSAQIYFANNDWPHNNIDFWRNKTAYTRDASVGRDGRWRWLFYDADQSLGHYTDAEFNMITWVTSEVSPSNGEEWPNTILRNLLANDSFRYKFINRLADHLNSVFQPDRVSQVLDSLATNIASAIEEHGIRWGKPHQETWLQSNTQMHAFASNRTEHVRAHIREHFDIARDIRLSISISSENQGYVEVNNLLIAPETPGVAFRPYPWTGIYFSDIPLTLKAIARSGYRFSHWSGDIQSEDTVITFIPAHDHEVTAHFVPL